MTRTVDQEWKHAVIGTVLSVSLGGILLGIFQLADGESIGTLPLLIGSIGVGLLLYRSWDWLQTILRWLIASITDDDESHATLVEHARGDNVAVTDEHQSQRNPSEEDTTQDEPETARTERTVVSKRS